MTEKTNILDQMLSAGWSLPEDNDNVEKGIKNKFGEAAYILLSLQGHRLCAVFLVHTKTKNLLNDIDKSINYARSINCNLIILTNEIIHYVIDVSKKRNITPEPTDKFPTPLILEKKWKRSFRYKNIKVDNRTNEQIIKDKEKMRKVRESKYKITNNIKEGEVNNNQEKDDVASEPWFPKLKTLEEKIIFFIKIKFKNLLPTYVKSFYLKQTRLFYFIIINVSIFVFLVFSSFERITSKNFLQEIFINIFISFFLSIFLFIIIDHVFVSKYGIRLWDNKWNILGRILKILFHAITLRIPLTIYEITTGEFSSKNNLMRCAWCDKTDIKFEHGKQGNWHWRYRNQDGSPDSRVKDNIQEASYTSIYSCNICNATTKFNHFVSHNPGSSAEIWKRTLQKKGQGERKGFNYEDPNSITVNTRLANRKGY